MGILDFDCMTTDPASTAFYGLTNAKGYGASKPDYSYNIVLAKSNTNPISLRTTTWSFASSYSSKSLSIRDGIPTTAGCAVDSRGIVTFIAVHYVFSKTDPYSKYISAVRYDPAGVADPTLSQGTGSWSVMSLNPLFGQSTFEKIWLFNSVVGGVETLNLAYLTRLEAGFQPAIVFGAYDVATATFNPTGRWDMTTLTFGSPMSILFRGSEMYYYATTLQSGVARLSVYSLTNVGTNVPTLSRAYNTTVCTDISPETRTAILQSTFYVVCSRSYGATLSTMAVLKDTTNPSSTFAPSTTFSTTLKNVDFMVAIGTANATTVTSTSPPFLLMQKSESYVKTNLQFSMTLTPGATFAVVEGGADATISQGFGIDPSSSSTDTYPRPTGGTGGSSGGGSGGDGGSTVIVVAGKLSVKIIIIIVVAALVVGGGILFCFFGCIVGCCLGIKESLTGKKSEDGTEATVVEVQPDWAQGQKAEEVGVVNTMTGAGAGAYPVMTEYQSPDHAVPLSPPSQAQDNGLDYLFTGTSVSATPLAPPVTGSPPSPTIPRHSRPGV
ncbi:hypothetical protein BG015_009409 [Linnemannia schmuckeri]|uniref:Transmembrane protein n=1 Tax=Linnemannia schmuckeri TaxID=64567 RepID=A0A9P5RVY7_9FUNG|nr:hypothetical protein BG015_009409 [Linnemannia schmuckeri]